MTGNEKPEGNPQDRVWYFAYGSNMHDSVFCDRRRMRPIEWRVGRVRGYRLRFNLEGFPSGNVSPANISADKYAEVWGVLYLITRCDMVRLSAAEGVQEGHYRPIWLEAEDQAETRLSVFTYIGDGLEKDGEPSERYVALLRSGARAHSLPKQWIKHLENVKSAK